MDVEYKIDKSELVIKSNLSGLVIWRGKPLGYPVEYILEDRSREICIVLLSITHGPTLYPGGPFKDFRNLICVDKQGELLWSADLPQSGHDKFIKIMWANKFSFDGFTIKPDFKKDL